METPAPTWRWWTTLRAVSVLNLLLWVVCAATLGAQVEHGPAQLACSAVFVLVCGFRAFLPRVDLERTVMVDHPLSSIALGRSAATAAELAFTVQSALTLEALGRLHGVGWIAPIAWAVVPLIAAAQLACWAAVLTLDHRGHAVEEALWTVYVVLVGAAFVGLWPAATGPALRGLLALGLVACAASAVLMAGVDVPMYVRRWREERARGAPRLALVAGLRDAGARREPTRAWETWRHEVPWMSLYFSGGVWLSLLMAFAPLAQLR